MRARTTWCLVGVWTCAAVALLAGAARGQTFRYEAEPRAGELKLYYSDPGPAPRLRPPARAATRRTTPRPMPQPMPQARRAAGYQRVVDGQVRPAAGVPRDERGGVLLTSEGEPIPPGVPVEPFVEDAPPGPPGGEVYYDDALPYEATLEPEAMGGPFLEEPACGGCGQCDQCCPRGCYLRRWRQHIGCLHSRGAYTENIDLYSGKQGFKGPVDQNVNGDFGFHVGANYGIPLFDSMGIGYQIGANLIISDFEGRSGPLGHRRSQFFATTGVFRRVSGERGLQGGAVVDYLRDDFYVQMDITQIRAELSYVYCQHEVGFWGAFGSNTSTHLGSFFPDQPLVQFSFEANNQYNLFYRYEFCNGTFCRTWIGMSGFGDGIFGSDATVRISERLGLMATYNYLLPRNQGIEPNNQTESWNLTIAMVWYPGYKRCNSWRNPYRPLFYVADNGWLMQRQAN